MHRSRACTPHNSALLECSIGMCLRQGMDAATMDGDARPRAEPEAQARGAALQREAWAAPAAPARSAGRHGAAPVRVPAERGRSVSGAAAAPLADTGRAGMPASGQRGARVREGGPAYTLSGGPGRTATPAPPPLYARAGAMWPRVEAWGKPGAARTGCKAERPTAAGPCPAAV